MTLLDLEGPIFQLQEAVDLLYIMACAEPDDTDRAKRALNCLWDLMDKTVTMLYDTWEQLFDESHRQTGERRAKKHRHYRD